LSFLLLILSIHTQLHSKTVLQREEQ